MPVSNGHDHVENQWKASQAGVQAQGNQGCTKHFGKNAERQCNLITQAKRIEKLYRVFSQELQKLAFAP